MGLLVKRNRSRSRSRSPHSDSDRTVKNNSLNFLQRVHPSRNTEQPNFVYLQAEFLRLTIDLIHKYKFYNQLKEYLNLLDDGEAIDLSHIKNSKIRKKLRHLFRSLYLAENNGVYTKPKDCDISLRNILDEFKEYIRLKCESLPLPDLDDAEYKNFEEVHPEEQPAPKDKEEGRGNLGSHLRSEEVKEESAGTGLATSLKSLKELHDEGFFIDYKELQKEFVKKHEAQDLWGMSVQEQMRAMNKRNKYDNE